MNMNIEFKYQADHYDVRVGMFRFRVKVIHEHKKLKDVEVSYEHGTVALTIDELKAILEVIKEGGYEL
jgi:hypothetical protein